MPMKQVPTAIIGIGCIFADSPDSKAFFHLLTRGRSAISDPPRTHRHLCDYLDPDPKKPDHIYCNRGGFLPVVDFDPTEFGIPPSVIEATDTSQLLGLMIARQALADAGYGAERTFDRSRTSVILGVTGTQELVIPLGARLGHPIWRKALADAGVPKETAESVVARIADEYVPWQENSFPGLLGNVVAGRIANRLDLGGTNCVVDAACASSMGALHMSLLELTSGRSDMVITGGVDTISDPFMHMCFSKTQILSPSGEIRPFSKDSDGTLLGEGIGMVVLKRLEDAQRDGDRVYAVIKGIGSASDGKSNSIYAPRPSGQAAALNQAYQYAGVAPETVRLVEAHGTGTRVGDQVEFQALCDVFGADSGNGRANGNRCALGSVKSNIGHTKAAAGTAGLIKAALSIYHKVLPPTLNARETDPKLGVADSPFYINHELRPWVSSNGARRRAGVSAFGFGGSNFHTVLEEHDPGKTEPSWDGSVEIAAFSGDCQDALEAKVRQWVQALDALSENAPIGHLTAATRRQFNGADPNRLTMVLYPADDVRHVRQCAHNALNRIAQGASTDLPAADAVYLGNGRPAGPLAFLFPGQGSQYVGMGRDLVCTFPDSLEALHAAEKHFMAEHALHEYLYPRLTNDPAGNAQRLKSTAIAQPAIGAVSVAMCEALAYFGIRPTATCGHSYGELVALHAAGWISRAALWELSTARGRLMAEAGAQAADGHAGTMLAVGAPLSELAQLVETHCPEVVLANRNSPDQGVLSGPLAAIEAAESACRDKGWKTVRLPVAAAFHSHLMASAQKPFQALVDAAAWTPGPVTVMSNTLGGAYPRDTPAAKGLLGRQLAHPVDFTANIETLHALGIRTFVEVGPKKVLSRLVSATLKRREHTCLTVDRSAGNRFGLVDLADVLAQLAAMGHDVRLDRWEKPLSEPRATRMRIPLSGANYRAPRAPQAPAKAPRQTLQQAPEEFFKNPTPATPAATIQPPAAASRPQVMRETMPDSKKTLLDQMFGTVQQGLHAMQALQAQTTQAHQKYLETQAEASKTLQQMLHSTRQLAGVGLGLPSVAASYVPSEAMAPPVQSAPSSADEKESLEAGDRPSPSPSLAQPAVPAAQPSSLPPKAAHGDTVQDNIQQIVSQLTGYPVEMLGLDMDIEADLGIDSIKRVEILSALEERMPHLPKVTPDMVGTLKTLGQICGYLCAGSTRSSAAGANPASTPDSEPSQAARPVSMDAVNTDEISDVLTQIVSQLTGYPVEMLGLDMDIEADLGIDSIKRVEILSALEERMPHLPKVTPDMVGTLKTLGQICEYLSNQNDKRAGHASVPRQQPDATAVDAQPTMPPCSEIKVVGLPPQSTAKLPIAADQVIAVIADRQDPLSGALVQAFAAEGFQAVLLKDRAEISAHAPIAGMVLLAPLDPLEAFLWVQAAASPLLGAAQTGRPFLYTLTRLDGAFGFYGQTLADPEQGALAGLAKTAALEWPNVRCGALDIDPHWSDVHQAARAAVSEMVHAVAAAPVEVGLNAAARVGLQLVPVVRRVPRPLNLAPADVVVVTGGARGVTAAAALALAAHTPCTLALLGRSPQPQAEPDWLTALSAEGQIKKAILQHALPKNDASPKLLEKAYKQIMANREMLATLAHCARNGIRAGYYALDVRDMVAVQAVMQTIRRDLGDIKAFVHGAGVLEDRLITDKTTDQFKTVYETKVQGLQALLAATHTDDLRYMVLFSSISARMGNTGQADYAMANEALNKIALQLSRQRRHCKVVSINWGPWDGGMVTPSLKRAFLSQGIDLISTQQGAAAMVAEMGHGDTDPVEVVCGGPLPASAPHTAGEPVQAAASRDITPPVMTQTAKRDIDLASCPVLHAHVLNGRPVVPLALMIEWLAHGALHANPGLTLHGIDHLRLLKGIVLDSPQASIRLMAGNPRSKNGVYEVDVEIRNHGQNGDAMVHSSATAILMDRLPIAPTFSENGHFKVAATPRPLDEIYQQVLFHGDALRGIDNIIRLTDGGMTATLRSAPAPEQWLSEPLRSRWIGDPLVLDCAFQMAIIWCHEQRQRLSLPSYAASYRQYRDKFPAEGVTAVMEVVEVTDRKIKGDFTFLDANKMVVASLKGYEAIMDQGLFKAFGVKAA